MKLMILENKVILRALPSQNLKRVQLKKELLKTLYNGKIEPACYWTAEYVCAGHYGELWNIILLFMSNNIHLGNPKLPIYIEMRFNVFKSIISNGYIGNELRLRNNAKIRSLFSEIISTLCLSKTKNSFDTISVKEKDFNMANITDKLMADNVSYGKDIFMSADPREFFIAINELAYHISPKSKNLSLARYWIKWILEFDKICNNKKKNCKAERRSFIPVELKYQMDSIWIVWELLLRESCKKGVAVKKIMASLLSLFCIRFTPASKKKKKYIIYFALSLLTEYIDLTIPLHTDIATIELVKNKINIIYKQVKKNEQSPKTSYLFNNKITNHNDNLEKTIEKLEKMDQLSHILHRK